MRQRKRERKYSTYYSLPILHTANNLATSWCTEYARETSSIPSPCPAGTMAVYMKTTTCVSMSSTPVRPHLDDPLELDPTSTYLKSTKKKTVSVLSSPSNFRDKINEGKRRRHPSVEIVEEKENK